MTRYLSLLAVVLVSLLGLVARATAQEPATPAASPVATLEPFELPALVLELADLEAAGFPGYTIGFSRMAGLPEGTVASPSPTGEWSTMQRFYGIWYSLTDPETGQIPRQIGVLIDEYPDAAGAKFGFDFSLAQNVADDPTAQDVDGTRTIGEETRILLFGMPPAVATPVAGQAEGVVPPWLSLELKFHLGTLVATVSIIDYTGQQPELADVERLAELLLARLTGATRISTPGLGFHALRLHDLPPDFDAYVRRDGVTLPITGEPELVAGLRNTSYGEATDAYRTEQVIPADEAGTAQDVYVHNVLAHFPYEAAASAAFAGYPATLIALPGIADYQERSPSAVLGDEATLATYIGPRQDAEPFYYVRATVREGRYVMSVTVIQAGQETDAAWVEALAAEAVACLSAEGWCPRVVLPAALMPIATPIS